MKRVCLLTGGPGVGKTTIIKRALAGCPSAGGFYTEEIRSGGTRLGFRLVTLEGESAMLAHVDIESPYRVGRYGVDLGGLERVGVAALRRDVRDCLVVVIDEIGKMELYSAAFRDAVIEALESGRCVVGTIMLAPHPWADAIKRRPEVEVVTVTRQSRQAVAERLAEWLKDRSRRLT